MAGIYFFAARRLQREYFRRVADYCNHNTPPSSPIRFHVLWYKRVWLNAFNINIASIKCLFQKSPDIDCIIDAWVKEKHNSPTHLIKPKSQRYWQIFTLIKRCETTLLYSIYRHTLIVSKPDIVVLWNGLKYRQRIVVSAAKTLDIAICYMENGLLPDKTTLDFRGINFGNSVPRQPTYYKQYYQAHNLSNIAHDTTVTATAPSALPPKELPDNYYFLPLQVNTDSQIIEYSQWLTSMMALIHAITRAYQKYEERLPYIVFKTHPKCPYDYSSIERNLRDQSNKFIFLNNVDSQILVRHSAAVITINSTVGINAIRHRKPLLVLGQAFYAIPGICITADGQEALENALIDLKNMSIDQEVRAAFLHYLKERYQIVGNWEAPTEEHLESVRHRLVERYNG